MTYCAWLWLIEWDYVSLAGPCFYLLVPSLTKLQRGDIYGKGEITLSRPKNSPGIYFAVPALNWRSLSFSWDMLGNVGDPQGFKRIKSFFSTWNSL